MRKILLSIVLTTLIFACKKTNTDVNSDPTPILTQNAWKLDRYTDTSGKTIPDASLNAQSRYLLKDINFEFRASGETRATNRNDNTIINKGTWVLINNKKIIDINITAFSGQFTIISVATGKLILQSPTGSFLTGVGEVVNMEFSAAN